MMKAWEMTDSPMVSSTEQYSQMGYTAKAPPEVNNYWYRHAWGPAKAPEKEARVFLFSRHHPSGSCYWSSARVTVLGWVYTQLLWEAELFRVLTSLVSDQSPATEEKEDPPLQFSHFIDDLNEIQNIVQLSNLCSVCWMNSVWLIHVELIPDTISPFAFQGLRQISKHTLSKSHGSGNNASLSQCLYCSHQLCSS